MPLDLTALQHGFSENALADILPDGAEPEAPAPLVAAIEAKGVPASKRLQIHRNHFATTLVEALAGIYEATRALVGQDYFDAFALRFARAHPPSSPCLFEYGGDVADALADAPGMADCPYVAVIARLEWAMHESFHAPVATALSPSRLSAVAPDVLPEVHLTPHPTLRLIAAPFPADKLWRATQTGDINPELLNGPATYLLLLRPDLDVQMESLPEGPFALLSALAAGASLGEAAATTSATVNGFDFSEALGACLARGVFADAIRTPH
jgi:hypothetical protein